MRNNFATALLLSVALLDSSTQNVNAVQMEAEAEVKTELEMQTELLMEVQAEIDVEDLACSGMQSSKACSDNSYDCEWVQEDDGSGKCKEREEGYSTYEAGYSPYLRRF